MIISLKLENGEILRLSPLQNIYLKLVPANQVPKALSRRHLEVVAVENGKYLTDEVLDFVHFYTTNSGDIEGMWIEIFCIEPGGRSLTQAFGYMGTIYLHTEVVPYWIIQPDYVNSLRRGKRQEKPNHKRLLK